MRLKTGESDEPGDFYKLKKENATLRAQLDALSTRGHEQAKALIEQFLKELGLTGDGKDGKLIQSLQAQNEDVKRMIRDLVSNIGNIQPGQFMTTGGGVPTQGGSTVLNTFNFGGQGGRLTKPPTPSVGVDGDISSGYTHKFGGHLEVADKDGRLGLGSEQTRYDVAFLQLQLQELLEINKRKEDELQHKNHEIETLYKRIRDYLVV